MNRKAWDQIVSASAAVIAVAMIVLGGFAIYGGNFGRDNVQTRLEPQNITFPPLDAMTPEEQADDRRRSPDSRSRPARRPRRSPATSAGTSPR